MEEQSLPTMEQPDIPELAKIARQYREAIDERLKLQHEREGPFKKRILDLMHENKLTVYQLGDIKIELKPQEEKVKVNIADDEGGVTDG